MLEKVELLSPAGNIDSFYAAIAAGADAVYLAGKEYGARAFADNFTENEIIECIKYAHCFKRKVYLTINTLMKQNEIEKLISFIKPLYEIGLDGVIVQDVGALYILRGEFPDLELHASTQMTICDSYGVEFLKKLGVCRVVPARELSLQEIKAIKEQTGISIETFIHGAMCYCYSGQCLFSSILGGRSGNRGRCAQPCRLPYSANVNGKAYDTGYPLSLKDMCTIENIPDLIKAGINSFKIEGRMKRPEYTAGVTAIYRKYIDLYYSGKEYKIDKKDLEVLSNLYIRSEVGNGYYYTHNGRNMITLANPSYSKTDEALLADISNKYINKKLKLDISINAEFDVRKPAKLQFSVPSMDIVCEYEGDIVTKANNRPITVENIEKQLTKLGDTIFKCKDINVFVSEDAFYPLGAINELRRHVCDLLLNKIQALDISRENSNLKPCEEYCLADYDTLQNNLDNSSTDSMGQKQTESCGYNVYISTKEQLKAIKPYLNSIQTINIDINILDSDLLKYVAENISDSIEKGCILPIIIRQKDHVYLDAAFELINSSKLFTTVIARSYDGVGYLLSQNYPYKIKLDSNMYCFNKEAVKMWNDQFVIKDLTIPLELNAKEACKVFSNSSEKMVYGKIPMMVTANCIVNTFAGCNKNVNNIVHIKDRYNTSFPVITNCKQCYNVIYNSVPLSLHAALNKYNNLKLSFTNENFEETNKVMDFFIQLLSDDNKNIEPPFAEYTKGHEKRGVD